MDPYYTFHHELVNLKKKIMQLSIVVEERVRSAAAVISTRNEKEIQRLILTDYEVDDMEVEIEEDCLKILALHQPVASDLRFIIAVIKINNEIERIADQAVNIAIGVQHISGCFNGNGVHFGSLNFDFTLMSDKTVTMLKLSLDALVERDASMARKVFLMDDEIDTMCSDAYIYVRDMLKNHPERPGCLINAFMLAKNLERIGDRATNIAEEVIHLVEGTIVRNQESRA